MRTQVRMNAQKFSRRDRTVAFPQGRAQGAPSHALACPCARRGATQSKRSAEVGAPLQVQQAAREAAARSDGAQLRRRGHVGAQVYVRGDARLQGAVNLALVRARPPARACARVRSLSRARARSRVSRTASIATCESVDNAAPGDSRSLYCAQQARATPRVPLTHCAPKGR